MLSKSDKDLKTDEAYHTLYHLIDDDGGGSVSPLEFSILLRMLGWNVTVEQSEALILGLNEGK